MGWARYMVFMGERRSTYKILVGKRKEKAT
jgi:hypothetical protein